MCVMNWTTRLMSNSNRIFFSLNESRQSDKLTSEAEMEFLIEMRSIWSVDRLTVEFKFGWRWWPFRREKWFQQFCQYNSLSGPKATLYHWGLALFHKWKPIQQIPNDLLKSNNSFNYFTLQVNSSVFTELTLIFPLDESDLKLMVVIKSWILFKERTFTFDIPHVEKNLTTAFINDGKIPISIINRRMFVLSLA